MQIYTVTGTIESPPANPCFVIWETNDPIIRAFTSAIVVTPPSPTLLPQVLSFGTPPILMEFETIIDARNYALNTLFYALVPSPIVALPSVPDPLWNQAYALCAGPLEVDTVLPIL